MFRKLLDRGEAGDNVGCLLRGIEKEQVERGQVLATPGSLKTHKKFEGEMYVLKKEEGGRHKPFFTNYRPQFYMRTTDVTGTVELPESVKMVMPGDNVTIDGRAHHARSRSRRSSASPSAKAARPSAPASSPRSSSKLGERKRIVARLRRVRGAQLQDDQEPAGQAGRTPSAEEVLPGCQQHTQHSETK